jgi:hypothetical protein
MPTLNDKRNEILAALVAQGNNGTATTETLGTTSTTSSVASSITVETLKAANTARRSLKVVNDGSNTLYIKEGSAATTTDFTWKVFPDEMVIIDDYNGIVTGIWDVATGSARITETI